MIWRPEAGRPNSVQAARPSTAGHGRRHRRPERQRVVAHSSTIHLDRPLVEWAIVMWKRSRGGCRTHDKVPACERRPPAFAQLEPMTIEPQPIAIADRHASILWIASFPSCSCSGRQVVVLGHVGTHQGHEQGDERIGHITQIGNVAGGAADPAAFSLQAVRKVRQCPLDVARRWNQWMRVENQYSKLTQGPVTRRG